MASYLADLPGYFGEVLPGVKFTLIVTVASFAIGAVAGVPLALLRRSRLAPVRVVIRLVIDLVRSIPPITWLFLVYFGLPNVQISLTPVGASIAGLGLISAAYMAEIYRGGLLSVATGQWEAARAVGLRERDVLLRVVAPQMGRVIGPPAATYAIGLLKDSAIISTIGVLDITFRATAATQREGHGLDLFVAAGILYLLLSLPLAVLSRHVDRRLRARFSMV